MTVVGAKRRAFFSVFRVFSGPRTSGLRICRDEHLNTSIPEQTDCTEPRARVAVACRASLARGR